MPAYSNFVLAKGYDASDALDARKFVKMDGEETVTPVTAKTDVPKGVSIFDVTLAEIAKGKGASVLGEGIAEVISSGTTSPGELAGLTADGSVRTAQSGDRVVGQVVHGADDAGHCAVELSLPGYIL
jgi:hypothetical protein